MLSLAQWKTTRHVDHLDIGPLNPRFRGQNANTPHLNTFDAEVTAYAQATNNFDRVTALGNIVVRARTNYLTNQAIPQRYLAAVNTLYNAALTDLGRTCGMLHQMGRSNDFNRIANNQALLGKNVTLNVYYLAPMGANPNVGPIDAIINQHILNANALPAYQQAGLTFIRSNPAATVVTENALHESMLLPAIPSVPVAAQGKFAEGGIGGRRFIEYCNATAAAAGSIDVVYADHFDQPDVQGRTYRAGSDNVGATPARPIVAVTFNPPVGRAATYPTTLAHELGHALTGDADHSIDGNNLMSGGAIRNANNQLTHGQIAWFRNNRWT